MRVAVVCPTRRIPALAPGGASVHLRSIAGGFAATGADVEIWAARGGRDGDPDEPLPDGVTLRVASRGRLPGALRKRRSWDERVDATALARQALRWARAHPPDLVYERFALYATVGSRLRARLRVPWLLEVNAPVAWEAAWYEGAQARPSLLRWEERTLQAADRVVVVSEALAAYVRRRGVAQERVLVLPNGAAARPLAQPSRDDRFVLGYAGTFKPWQGLLAEARALPALAQEVAPRPLELHLWGDGPDRVALVDAARSLDVAVADHGWGRVDRSSWHAAWAPRGDWPPPGGQGFGEPPPDRYFSPLKEAEAAAARVPLFQGGRLSFVGPLPATWEELAGTILGTCGVDRVKMRTAHG